ncbi:hypothetical protein T440DRAFT_484029 [Plenodomus tracheiphilus IPT5]|uniref:Uncharacterized protein n=1 Tax=Plenodomus tracheiphilus IPT5 TaxID=1408161 RepID=A0A6A7APD9_9PLEO|nr:hypothetical protein T440DRAFT_484029 [Plenodomus tracheiphilus IPT5]
MPKFLDRPNRPLPTPIQKRPRIKPTSPSKPLRVTHIRHKCPHHGVQVDIQFCTQVPDAAHTRAGGSRSERAGEVSERVGEEEGGDVGCTFWYLAGEYSVEVLEESGVFEDLGEDESAEGVGGYRGRGLFRRAVAWGFIAESTDGVLADGLVAVEDAVGVGGFKIWKRLGVGRWAHVIEECETG